MRLLLDACVWGGACRVLEDAGHDVVWAGDWRENSSDEQILARAHAEGRILVTLDKDFGQLAVVRGLPHHGIVRLVNLSAREQGSVCLRVLDDHGSELEAGGIATVDPGRLRIRAPDSEAGRT